MSNDAEVSQISLEDEIKKIQNKVYNLGNEEFRLKPFNLNFLQALTPLIIKMRQAQARYTEDIDMSRVSKLKKDLYTYSTAIKQNAEIIDKWVITEKDTQEKLDELCERNLQLAVKYENIKREFDTNFLVQQDIKLYNDLISLATAEVILDISVIKNIFSKILQGNVSNINYDNPEIIDFISAVMNDFFTYVKKMKFSAI